ncbi:MULTISPECIES: hypothetical protein [unclassified Saccharicrinis]|uniref:hypothetical protein n=1 Tax=unclassified Saccharicrinis TaxID=2646859 RepID=UPI003D328C7F
MSDFTKAEKIAVRYLIEWGQYGDVEFPDSIVTSYFDLFSGTEGEQQKAVKQLCGHVKGLLGEEKSREVEKQLLSCII